MLVRRLLYCVPFGAACGPIGAHGSQGEILVQDGAANAGTPGAGSAGTLPGKGNGAISDSGAGGRGVTTGDAGPSQSDGSSSYAAAPGGYHVVGPTVYDANGKPHVFHGLDRPSLEWAPGGEHLSRADYDLMASWKANVVRIALNQDFWLQGSPSFSAGYEALVDEQVHAAEAAGLDVILDLHWSDKGDFGTPAAQQRMADAHSVIFWQGVAPKYKNDGRVMFELYNEPHDVTWDVWLDGGPSGDGFTAAGMQALYDTVRGTGAENLVLIGGLRYAFDLSGVAQYPVQGHNIVYASHPYNTPTKQPSTWDAAFGFLAAAHPVMLTEFGDLKSCAVDYYAQAIAYADARKISWSGWAWYPQDCQFPSLISDWNGTPTAAGQVEKTALQSY